MSKVVDKNYFWGVLSGPFIVIASMVWPVMVFITTFTLFYVYHPNATDRVRTVEQIPTLSGTGELLPESVVFTYGLHVEAGLVALLFILIYTAFESEIREIGLRNTLMERLRTDTRSTEHRGTPWCDFGKWLLLCCPTRSQRRENVKYLRFWNIVLLFLGLFAALFMSLTGSVSLKVHEPTHTAFAVIMFVCAAFHLIVFYFTIAEPLGTQPYQRILHTVCLVVVVPFNIVMIVALRLMLAYCTARTCIAVAVDLMVVLEYTTTLAFLAYMFRFYDVVKHVTMGAFVRSIVVPLEGDANGAESAPEERQRAGFKSEGFQSEEAKAADVEAGVEDMVAYSPPPRSQPALIIRRASHEEAAVEGYFGQQEELKHEEKVV